MKKLSLVSIQEFAFVLPTDFNKEIEEINQAETAFDDELKALDGRFDDLNFDFALSYLKRGRIYYAMHEKYSETKATGTTGKKTKKSLFTVMLEAMELPKSTIEPYQKFAGIAVHLGENFTTKLQDFIKKLDGKKFGVTAMENFVTENLPKEKKLKQDRAAAATKIGKILKADAAFKMTEEQKTQVVNKLVEAENNPTKDGPTVDSILKEVEENQIVENTPVKVLDKLADEIEATPEGEKMTRQELRTARNAKVIALYKAAKADAKKDEDKDNKTITINTNSVLAWFDNMSIEEQKTALTTLQTAHSIKAAAAAKKETAKKTAAAKKAAAKKAAKAADAKIDAELKAAQAQAAAVANTGTDLAQAN